MGEPTRKHPIPGKSGWMKREMRKPFRIMFWILVVLMGVALLMVPMMLLESKDEVDKNNINQGETRVVSEKRVAKKRSNHTKSSFNISFEEMRENYNSMTQVQWEQYSQKLRGRKVEWCGWVEDVERKYLGRCELQVDMDSPKSWGVQEVFFDVSENLAMKLNKDQFICFHGTIESVGKTLFTLYIMLKDVSVQIR